MSDPKTVIGILASHDDGLKNIALAEILKKHHKNLAGYQLVFTGGTYDRLFDKKEVTDRRVI